MKNKTITFLIPEKLYHRTKNFIRHENKNNPMYEKRKLFLREFVTNAIEEYLRNQGVKNV